MCAVSWSSSTIIPTLALGSVYFSAHVREWPLCIEFSHTEHTEPSATPTCEERGDEDDDLDDPEGGAAAAAAEGERHPHRPQHERRHTRDERQRLQHLHRVVPVCACARTQKRERKVSVTILRKIKADSVRRFSKYVRSFSDVPQMLVTGRLSEQTLVICATDLRTF